MTLIVETGSIVANAESYLSVSDADTYHAKLGNTEWATLSTEKKEQLLRKSTQYMCDTYRRKWSGFRYSHAQPLDWPRQGVVVDDYGVVFIVDYHTIPIEVKNACALLALKANSIDLNPDLEPQVTSEAVASLSVTYQPGARQSIKFKQIDDMLAIYLKSNGCVERG